MAIYIYYTKTVTGKLHTITVFQTVTKKLYNVNINNLILKIRQYILLPHIFGKKNYTLLL